MHSQTLQVLAGVAVDVVDGAVGGGSEGGWAVGAGRARAAGARGRVRGGCARRDGGGSGGGGSDGGRGIHFDVDDEDDVGVDVGSEKTK